MAETTLTITTILGQQQATGDRGPFLLAAVNGIEGISIPFSYDLTLFRRSGEEDVDPSLLINTPAKFGIRRKKGGFLTRCGVFETFEKTGTNEQASKNQTDFLVYRARLVPVIKMLDYEQAFRVFEGMTVMDIVKEALGDFTNLNPSSYLSPSFGPHDIFPAIDYCVQFNETTFAFVSRLLAEFGIWYHFEHPSGDDPRPLETMVLGRTPLGFKPCDEPDLSIDFDEADDDKIADFRRGYQIPHRRTRVGDYNTLKPSKPTFEQVSVTSSNDTVPGDDFDGTRFQRQTFPSHTPQADQGGDAHALRTDATINQNNEEARVFIAQGQTKNRTFRAGRHFHITEDGTAQRDLPGGENQFGTPKNSQYLLTRVAIAAFERALGQSVGSDIVNFINPWHWWKRATKDQTKPGVDVASAISASAMTNWLQDESKHIAGGDGITHLSSALSGVSGMLGNVLQFFGTSIKEIAAGHDDDYSNSFVAVPWQPGVFSKVPLPLYTPARANGPQIAVVIGPQGLSTDSSDVFTDALGRVRVRFPWHTDLPEPGEADPWKTARRTAWLRVSDGWAGQGMGTQFLPRIGDEVIVSFIDGDPARPVVTGRLYNARTGVPGLPFPANRAGPKPVGEAYVHKPGADNGATGPNSATLRSGIRTRSTPRPEKSNDRFHMLRFDDAWKDEQFLLRSQGRTDFTSYGTWYDTSHGNRHIRIGGKDPDTGKGGGALMITTGDEYDLHVGADRIEGVDKGYQLSVKRDTLFDLQGNHDVVIGGGATLNATDLVIEAKMKITLKVGGSFIVLGPAGVFIKGAMVEINSGGSPGSTSDADVTDPLDAGTADPGDPPNWLALHPPQAGGARKHHTAKAQHGLLVKANPDGTLQVGPGIKVAGNQAYQDTVVQQLALMDQTQTGHAMLTDYGGTGRTMTIAPASPPPNPPNAFATPTNGPAAQNGTGSDSTVQYNPEQWPNPVNAPNAPGDVLLFHEMTHAQHNAHGTQDNTARPDNFDNNEEFNTIGPENQYRDERGVPRRPDHHSL